MRKQAAFAAASSRLVAAAPPRGFFGRLPNKPGAARRFCPPPRAGGAAEEEKTEFNIELTEVGANKIAVIKVVREITGAGLVDAKKMVDGAPSVLKENASKDEAEDAKKKLEEAGAKVTLK